MDIVVRLLVDAIYLAVGIITVVVFIKRGFVESVFRFGRYIAAVVISYFAGPHVGDLIFSKILYKGLFGVVSNSTESFLMNTAGSVDIDALVDSLPFLIQKFVDADKMKVKYGHAVDNFGTVADDFAATVATPIAEVLSDILAYILVYFAALLLLWVMFAILNRIFRARALNVVNGIFGGIIGVLVAVLFLIVLTWIINLILALIGFDSEIAEYVGKSRVYSFFGNK